MRQCDMITCPSLIWNIGPEAFQPDPASSRLAPEPLVKASTQLMALINSLCAMLRTTPFHRENYSRLILGVIIQFYQRCSDRFTDLVSLPTVDGEEADGPMALSAQWAQRSEVSPCLTELATTVVRPFPYHLRRLTNNSAQVRGSDLATQHQMCRQETHLEMQLLGLGTVDKKDIIVQPRNLSALGSLYRSVVRLLLPRRNFSYLAFYVDVVY